MLIAFVGSNALLFHHCQAVPLAVRFGPLGRVKTPQKAYQVHTLALVTMDECATWGFEPLKSKQLAPLVIVFSMRFRTLGFR